MRESLVYFSNLNDFFSEKTRHLKGYQEPTKAYITNVFTSAKKQNADFSGEILTLVFARASFECNFGLFQSLGDWILFAKSTCPRSLSDASSDYYNALAQTSYYRCYRILDKKWILFEELADTFPRLVRTLQPLMSFDEMKVEEPTQTSSPILIQI